MGRLPVIEGPGTNSRAIGRDHNVYGFNMWLAGGGLKSGHIHGATDEFGFEAIEDRVGPADYLATISHLLGLDPNRLTFSNGARENSFLDGQSCRIVKEILKSPLATVKQPA